MGDAYELVCHRYREGEHPKIYLAPLCHLIGTVIPHPPQSFSDHHGTWESKVLSPEFKGPRPPQMPTPQWKNVPKGLIFPDGIMAGGTFFLKKAGCCLGRGGIPPKKVFTPPKYTNKKCSNLRRYDWTSRDWWVTFNHREKAGENPVWWGPLKNQPHIHKWVFIGYISSFKELLGCLNS